MTSSESGDRVSAFELRRLFIESGYAALVETGALIEFVEADGHPSQSKANEPYWTRSQIIAYRDEDGTTLARVHRYLRTDGTIGASGKPDPKFIRYNGVAYKQITP